MINISKKYTLVDDSFSAPVSESIVYYLSTNSFFLAFLYSSTLFYKSYPKIKYHL